MGQKHRRDPCASARAAAVVIHAACSIVVPASERPPETNQVDWLKSRELSQSGAWEQSFVQ
jgi:hypothetical protein